MGGSNRSSISTLSRLLDDDIPTPRLIMSSRSVIDHSKASLMALAHLITKSTLKASTVIEMVDDSQSGETVINIIEPDYSDSQYELPFEEVNKLAVFFEESIREILLSSTEEMGEFLVREFLSNFLDSSEENEEDVMKLCKRLLAMPHLWEESDYMKVARTVKYDSDMLAKITTQALAEVIEETIKDLTTKMYGEKEVSKIRRELRILYYKKACQVTRSTPHPIILDALNSRDAEKGIIDAQGRGGDNKGILTDSDILALSLCIKYGLRVTRLNLRNNEITDFGLWHLSHLLRLSKLSNLIQIDLAENNLSGRGIAIFCDTIKDHANLKTIILKGNLMGEFGGLSLVTALKYNNHLTRLDITSTDIEMKCLVALLVIVTHHPTLQTLKLGRPLIFSEQEEPLIHLSRVFKVNSVLRCVHVPKFSISDFGVSIIVPGLIYNETLVHLDFSCNKIVWDGAKLLAEYIKKTPSLKVLDLNANRLEDVGANYIALALAKPNVTLRKLIVTNNNIGVRGLCALAAGVKQNLLLSHLHVWGNKMQGKACLALASLLATGRLKSDCVDFIPYKSVDGVVSLALARN